MSHHLSFKRAGMLLVLLLVFGIFLILSPRAQAGPRISPEKAVALALEDLEPIGDNFRISDMGGDVTYDAYWSGVAYNATNDEYLIVWHGDDNTSGLADEEFEIFGQRLDANTGEKIGENFRISDMGTAGSSNFDAYKPSVAYNATQNQYLVVWEGDDGSGAMADEEFEIFGQRINATSGAEVGTNDFRISEMGTDGDVSREAYRPVVAYSPTFGDYLVVWYGDEVVNDEWEIYGQRVDAATGAEIGVDFVISDMGPPGDTEFDAWASAVTYNPTNQEYLVVWEGNDNTGGLVNGEYEIFGQRLSGASGAEIGTNDFRISHTGGTGDANRDAEVPEIVYNPTANEYLVVWQGDDSNLGLADNENEILGQRLDAATGSEIGADFRISDMGTDGDTNFWANWPVAVYNPASNEYLIVWYGDDNFDQEFEIYGQRLNATTGAEIGTNDFRMSDMGSEGDVYFGGTDPVVAYNSTENVYLVAWNGDDYNDGLVNDEYEIFAQRLDSTGTVIGANDFRVSDMGGDVLYDAYHPAVAYNPVENEYLVVWEGDDNTSGLADEEFEIYGQRIDASGGTEIGTEFRLSDMDDGDQTSDAEYPAVAYNSTNHEYLVVWHGHDSGLVNDEYEIFGQRLDAATGAEISPNDFRISDIGPDGDPIFDAYRSAVAYNPSGDEYLVVWYGDDNTGGLADEEYEIYGQRIDAPTGAEFGEDFRLSNMGPDGDANYDAYAPAVTYNPAGNEYLVLWRGDDNAGGLVDEEFEIFGQRVDAVTGVEVGMNDFRVSSMGPDGDSNYDAYDVGVAYNSSQAEYLVVWYGDDNAGGLADEEFEVYGQRLDGSTGAEIGDDFRMSEMGPDGNTNYDAFDPAVSYNLTENEYLVVWHGDDNTNGLVDQEFEIFGQRISPTGVEIGPNDFLLSHMGPDGDPNYNAVGPAIAYNLTNHAFLVSWYSDDSTNGLIDEEFEIFGQRLQVSTPPPLTPTPGPLYLPAVLNHPCFSGLYEIDPNTGASTATGPLCSAQDYLGFPEDAWDYWYFFATSAGTLTIDLTHPLADVGGAQVQLYYQTVSVGTKVGEDVTAPYQIVYTGLSGKYYVVVFTDTDKCGPCSTPYTLQVTHP